MRVATATHVRATPEGDVVLTLRFAVKEYAGGRGTVVLRSSRAVPSRYLARGRRRLVTFGGRTFSIGADGTAGVTIRLAAEKLALVRRMQWIDAVVLITATDRTGVPASARRRVTLHAPRLASAAEAGPRVAVGPQRRGP